MVYVHCGNVTVNSIPPRGLMRNEMRTKSLFENPDFDSELYKRALTRPEAPIKYVIYFTPRSGSSWLTDILAQTKRLSRALEAFNPSFVPNITKAINASNLNQYCNILDRRFNTQGVFGFEITMHQLNAVFPTHDKFIERYGEGPCFWLIRQDIVAQAVSLAKMVTTQVGHTANATDEQRQSSDKAFTYDKALIKHWLTHILNAERQNEQLFQDYGLSPLRVSYEQITALRAPAVVDIFARHIGVTDMPPVEVESTHTKLGTSRNDEYATRFRKEAAPFMQKVDEERAPWLARLAKLEA